MIREEYDFRDIAEYLYKTTDLLIAGVPTCEPIRFSTEKPFPV